MTVVPEHGSLRQTMNLRIPGLAIGLWLACAAAVAAGERVTLNFNPDWRFTKSDPPGAEKPDFDDRDWAVVSTPHTFNDVDTFDNWATAGHEGEMIQWSGRTWYRKTFVLPRSFDGRKVFIEFEAARQIAEVYLNGTPLGQHKDGFIPFGFDLTPHLRTGGARNVLAVMCDNRFSPETHMPLLLQSEMPWNSPHWHPAHGGLYRNVRLHVTDPLHITLPLFNSLQTVGPYAYTARLSESSADVGFEVPVKNGRGSAQDVVARVRVLDAFGRTALALDAQAPLAAGASHVFTMSGSVEKPRLWDPDDPHVYRVLTTIEAGGAVVDSSEVPLGIRSVRWDAQNGFFINGRRVKLRGWGQKPTDEWPGLGAAHPDWLHHYTLALMKEAGGNFVRWGHCAGGPASLTASDRLGLAVAQPGVDGEGDLSGEAWRLRAEALRDTIVYYRNHPSILIWEGGNQKVSREHAQELRGYIDRYDPHGGRAYAHRRADAVTGEFLHIALGTEGGREIPQLPVVEGEYDREESPRRVWDDPSPPNFGYPEAKGQTYQLTSEQFAVNQVAQFVRKLGAWSHCGGANWIFSDSTSGGRMRCEVARTSGEVDAMRLPKEAYHAVRVMFRADPQVHIIGHWTYPAGTVKKVYVVSNAEKVDLLVNGKPVPGGTVSDRFLFTFPDVAWEAGQVEAVATSGGTRVASQIKKTAGAAAALRLTPIVGPGGLRADGSDVVLIDVEAVDARGERCPTFQQRVDFETTGPGVWRGGYNSGKIDSINHPFLDLEAGINRVSVRATRAAGAITVRARSEGLTAASVTIESRPVDTESGMTAVLPEIPAASLAPEPPARVVAVADGVLLPESASSQRRVLADTGRYATAFAYSGPAPGVRIEGNGVQEGKRIYTDMDAPYTGLPDELKGADAVQTAHADRLYRAVDLIEIAVKAGTVVRLAHDDGLPKPIWLTGQFKRTDLALTVNGRRMTIFERRALRDESLTLGSNHDGRPRECNMYFLMVSSDGSR